MIPGNNLTFFFVSRRKIKAMRIWLRETSNYTFASDQIIWIGMIWITFLFHSYSLDFISFSRARFDDFMRHMCQNKIMNPISVSLQYRKIKEKVLIIRFYYMYFHFPQSSFHFQPSLNCPFFLSHITNHQVKSNNQMKQFLGMSVMGHELYVWQQLLKVLHYTFSLTLSLIDLYLESHITQLVGKFLFPSYHSMVVNEAINW